MYDLMKDIDSLSSIDYPKMLSLNVHSIYQPYFIDIQIRPLLHINPHRPRTIAKIITKTAKKLKLRQN
jgi:hypothetical protein